MADRLFDFKQVKNLATEAEIKRACVQLLTSYQNQGKLIFQRNNNFFGSFQRADGSRGFIQNNSAGAPDFYVFLSQGQTIHLELKTAKGKQNEAQKEWQKNCELLGHTYVVVRGVDELNEFISLL